jgi:hypothetical protein
MLDPTGPEQQFFHLPFERGCFFGVPVYACLDYLHKAVIESANLGSKDDNKPPW